MLSLELESSRRCRVRSKYRARLRSWTAAVLTLQTVMVSVSWAADAAAPPQFDPQERAGAAVRALAAILELQDSATGLVDSFSADAEEKPDQAGHVGFLFDQALALLALAHAGKNDAAAADAAGALAQALIDLQAGGSWVGTYDTTTAKGIGNSWIETGPNAWTAYGLLYYATELQRENGQSARAAAAAFARYASENLRDPAALDRYDYWWGDAPGAYLDGRFYSVEINLDMWWLLYTLGESVEHPDPRDDEERTMSWWAARLFEELINGRGYWSESEERWNRGPNDPYVSEDVLMWGSITDLFAGAGSRQHALLDFALDPGNGLLIEGDYETYFHGARALTGLEDNVDPGQAPGSCSETIWNEASGHAVCALLYADRASEADLLLNSLIAAEDEVAGVRGWTHSLDSISDSCGEHYGPEWGIHVGASAWTYFAVHCAEDDWIPYPAPEPSSRTLYLVVLAVLALLRRSASSPCSM